MILRDFHRYSPLVSNGAHPYREDCLQRYLESFRDNIPWIQMGPTCRRLLPNLLRQRTRKQNESNDPSSFKFGSWENQVAALKLIDMNSFRGEILSEATGNGSIEEEEVKDIT